MKKSILLFLSFFIASSTVYAQISLINIAQSGVSLPTATVWEQKLSNLSNGRCNIQNEGNAVSLFGNTSILKAMSTTWGGIGSIYYVQADTGWDNGSGTKGWEISANTKAFENMSVSFRPMSYNRNGIDFGPRDFKIQYSLNNSTWTDLGTTYTSQDTWSSGLYTRTLPSECNDKSVVYLRWIMSSNIATDGGSIRGTTPVSAIGNILITGDVIPYSPTDILLSSNNVDLNGTAERTVGTLSSVDINECDTNTYSFVTGDGDTNNDDYIIDGNILKVKNAVLSGTENSVRINVNDGTYNYAKSFTINLNQHCSIDSSDDYYYYISKVEFNTLASTSLNNGNGYEDYTSESTSVNIGSTYNISVDISTNESSSEYPYYLRAYIDWNHDGIFDTSETSNEVYDLNSGTEYDNQTISSSITVPDSAITGETVMRITVRGPYGGIPAIPEFYAPECGTFDYGEAEDYTLNVNTAVVLPTVTTTAVTNYNSNAGTLGGNVTSDGGETVAERGVVYSTTDSTPEIGEAGVTKDTNGTGTGEFSEAVTGLAINTTHYVRAYATNSVGTAYGDTVSFTTLKATPNITTAPTATAITYGDALSASTLSGGVATVAGTFAFTDDSITPDAETYTAGVTFTPTDTTNYNTATTTINVTVNKAVSVITWGNPSDITYGTALSGTELNAEANVAGTFEYTPAINTVLTSGHSQSLSVTFTPDDTTNYTTETKTVSINVSPAEITAKADDKTRNYGEANPEFTITYSGFVNGEDETAVTTASTAVTTATANSPAGTYDITVNGGTAPNYTFTYTKGTLTINGIIPTATTGTASTLTTRQATLNGTVADNGGNTVTEKGICISTSANPTTADTCITDTSEGSEISGTFTGLTPNTTYHYRAYATTLEGTGYGNDQTFITYKAVTITTGQSFSVNENESALTAVGTIEITGDIQGTANYTITAGDTENIFQMSGAEIQVADATKLDYETAVSHTVTVKVEDDENTSEETVTINLTNLNDNTPVITDSQYTLSENALNGTVIATLSAADADGTLNELTYTIETGNNDGIFALNPATGELTVIDNTNLDYETTASYSLGIKVSDTANEASATVTVTITDDTGTCAEPTEIDTLPFTVDTTTAERYSNITNYGANCGETTYGENDHTYVYTVSAGDKIEITATPETDYDLILMIQSDCGNNCDTYANEGTAGTAETIIYEATENKDIYIIVEGINGSGTYTLDVKVKVEETPDEDELTDDDEIIDEETDEDIYPVDEDEITDDDATSTDEDEVIDEETDEDIYPADEDEITDDDATSTDEDETIDEETDEDIYPADEDEVTDTETDNDVTEVIDEENDEETDTEETDLDIVKPSSDDGCGCSVISW